MAYVLGDVGRPGGYVMQNNEKISRLQAVAMAHLYRCDEAYEAHSQERFQRARNHP